MTLEDQLKQTLKKWHVELHQWQIDELLGVVEYPEALDKSDMWPEPPFDKKPLQTYQDSRTKQ